MTTGRTVGKFFKFQITDVNKVLRDLEVDTVNGFGVTYPQVDVSALQDALKGFLPGQPDATLTITGPVSNKAATAASGTGVASTPSGSLSVLPQLLNNFAPKTIGIYVGLQGVWATGDPVWGVQSDSVSNGVLLFDYTTTIGPDVKYSATFKFFPGSAAPTWGTSQL